MFRELQIIVRVFLFLFCDYDEEVLKTMPAFACYSQSNPTLP